MLPSARRGEGPLPWFVFKDSEGGRLFYAIIPRAIATTRSELISEIGHVPLLVISMFVVEDGLG